MESEKFHYHESGETVNKGWYGIEFEKNFGKFLLFRLICQRKIFRKFRFTREKKGTGKFDDFVFAYDSIDGKTKYSLFQLKHLSDENKKINLEDLEINSKSKFSLPYYFDYYSKSLSCLSSDKDFEGAELDGLFFCTNVGIEDSQECLSIREIPNEGLFRDCGKLYKISLSDQEREKIFSEQFLSERKRLANELASSVIQNKRIDLPSIIADDSFSLIHKFSEMLLEHVVDAEKNKFKDSFLVPNLENKELDNFRNEFFDSLFALQEKFPHTRKIKLKELKNSSSIDERDISRFIEFLRSKTIIISTISKEKTIKKLSEELVLSIMLQKPFDIKSKVCDQKYFQVLSKFIREEVIDVDSRKLKETFLCNKEPRNNKELSNFRQCFLEDLRIFCEDFKKSVDKIDKHFEPYNTNFGVQSFLSAVNLIWKKEEWEIIEFLKCRKIRFAEFSEADTSTEMFPSGKVDTLEIDEKVKTFLNLITFAVNQNNFKNFISNEMNKIITKKEDQTPLYEDFISFMDTWYNEGILSFHHLESKLKYRIWITEEELLNSIKNLNILFQNRKVKLSEVCSNYDIFTPEVFMYNFNTLKNNAIMNFGEDIDKDFESFYIPRTLVQSKKVNINALVEEKSQDIFIFTVPERFNPSEEFNSLSVEIKDLELFNCKHNYYYTRGKYKSNSFMDFFIKNRKDISSREVHWITFLGEDFKYESSLPVHKTFSEKHCSDSAFCSNSNLRKKYSDFENENFVIVTGEPGIGKSVLLKRIAVIAKNLQKRQSWVIFIPLNKYKDYLDEYDCLNNIQNVLDFLGKSKNCKSKFSRNVLKYYLENKLTILLFDGFDEIHEPSKQEKILRLLQFLKNENLSKQIFITSRPHCVRQIEEVLECVSYDIKDISEDEQTQLVINEWKSYHDSSKINLIKLNAKIFVKNINNFLGTKERDFFGVPLLIYMFSHAYKDEAEKSSLDFPQNFSLVRLFEDFIERRYNIFFSVKVPTDEILQDVVKNDSEKCYQMFALRFISPKHLNISKTVDIERVNESIERLKKIGLIYENSGVCTFIHETFAQYYVADLLLSIIENCHDENVLKSVKNILLEPENDMILEVFDAHLIKKFKGYKIQKCIVNGDEDFISGLNKDSLSTVDILGRNCFYYAIKNNPSMLSYLINEDVELSFEPFFGDILKVFVDVYKVFKKIVKGEKDVIYCKLFEYILEKENENGYFANHCLDHCLRIEAEIQFGRWEIARKLINKFGRKLRYPSSYYYYIFDAPDEYFDEFLKLSDEDGAYYWVDILQLLLRFDTRKLEEIIVKHRQFILRMPLCIGLLNENYNHEILIKKFSGVVDSIKRYTKNFSLLFKFLFESKDVSFEEFDDYNEFYNKDMSKEKLSQVPTIRDGNFSMSQLYVFLICKESISFLRTAIDQNRDSYAIDLLKTLDEYMNVCDYDENSIPFMAGKQVIFYLLSRGDEEHVKRIFNVCCSYGNLKEASQHWEEAKRTELSHYYKIKTKN